MPIFKVKGPDGTIYPVNAPEGATEEQAVQYVAAQVQKNPDFGKVEREKPNLLVSVGRGMMDIGQGAKQLYLNAKDSATGGHEADDYTKQVNDDIGLYEKGRGPDAGLDWGRIGGNIAATAPLGLIAAPEALAGRIAVGAAQGAVQGGLGYDEQNNHGSNAVVGALTGGAFPAAGGLVKGGVAVAKDALTPNAKALIQLAAEKGIPLSASQQTGSKVLDAIESTTGKLPFSKGDEFARTQQNALNKSLADTMGETLQSGETQLTPDIMQRAGGRLGKEFEKISAGKPVPVTTDLRNAVDSVEAANNNKVLRDPQVGKLVDDFRTQYAPRTAGAPRAMSGEEAQDLRSRFSAEAASAGRSSEPGASQRADFYRQMRDAVDKSIYSTLSPDEKTAWDTAKGQYANFKTISKALSGTAGETGDVSGSQLWNAVKSRQQAGKMATNNSELAQLASLGKDILKTKTPDSGTAGREMLYKGLGAVGAAGAGQEIGERTGHGRVEGGVAALGLGVLTSRTLRNQFIANAIRDGALPAKVAQMASNTQRAIVAAILAGKTAKQQPDQE